MTDALHASPHIQHCHILIGHQQFQTVVWRYLACNKRARRISSYHYPPGMIQRCLHFSTPLQPCRSTLWLCVQLRLEPNHITLRCFCTAYRIGLVDFSNVRPWMLSIVWIFLWAYSQFAIFAYVCFVIVLKTKVHSDGPIPKNNIPFRIRYISVRATSSLLLINSRFQSQKSTESEQIY